MAASRLGVPIVFLAVLLLTVAMLIDARMNAERLAPISAALLISLALLRSGQKKRGWIRNAALVAVGSLSSGGFALFATSFAERLLANDRPPDPSPGEGLARTIIAIGVGIAVVPIAAVLMAAEVSRETRSASETAEKS